MQFAAAQFRKFLCPSLGKKVCNGRQYFSHQGLLNPLCIGAVRVCNIDLPVGFSLVLDMISRNLICIWGFRLDGVLGIELNLSMNMILACLMLPCPLWVMPCLSFKDIIFGLSLVLLHCH